MPAVKQSVNQHRADIASSPGNQYSQPRLFPFMALLPKETCAFMLKFFGWSRSDIILPTNLHSWMIWQGRKVGSMLLWFGFCEADDKTEKDARDGEKDES